MNIKILIENLIKSKKNEANFLKAINEVENALIDLYNGTRERIIIFSVSWPLSAIMIITGTVLGKDASNISGSISGTDQGGTFNFRPDIFGFGVLFFIAPFIYMALRKVKIGKRND